MRKLSLILAAALLLALPLGADAKAHPHALAAVDSITVTDSTFGGSAVISYTLATVLGPTDILEALGACQATDGGWAQYAALADGTGTFTNIGPTPTWSSGGATCTASLLDWDWYNGTFTLLASTTFAVLP